ncbi:CRAL-TRIO domain-containing protein [Citrus sinensis]|uniref:CRAL-TRIO domain-containing protein n=1 Tax=Citrus sinensis TaxID=2711 RepID=A0ACB8NKP2_CITSI|nr:CRAL-TRIO domain-containing protein [Citrus sinensis]
MDAVSSSQKPIVPTELYRAVRDSQLIGMSGLSTFDKASVHCYVQSHIQINEYRDRVILPSASAKHGRPITTCVKVLDMTGLKLSALSQIKVVKPLLQERTRKKIQVLQGSGRDELLKIMDFESLPHFCRREDSGSSRSSENKNCFSLDHPFHQQLYNYIKQQSLISEPIQPVKQGSFHVDLPEPAAEGTEIAKTIESELHKIENRNGLTQSLDDV